MEVLTSCIIGAVLIILGLVLRAYPPEHINNNIGYKTTFAMKNKDTWYEGNRFCGTMLLFTGIIFIPFSTLMKHLKLSESVSVLGLIILLIVIIIFTEIHLRKLFDKNGVRK